MFKTLREQHFRILEICDVTKGILRLSQVGHHTPCQVLPLPFTGMSSLNPLSRYCGGCVCKHGAKYASAGPVEFFGKQNGFGYKASLLLHLKVFPYV